MLLALLLAYAPAQAPVETDLFTAGKGGYHTFRIPALLATRKGSLLAFCEGRKRGRGDSGDIDVVLRRSRDGGKTWLPLQVVAAGGGDTVGNPCAVVERSTGTVWLLLTHNLGTDTEKTIRDGTGKGTRRVWVTSSADEGATWSRPADVTRHVKDPKWTWYATGPGVGVQLTGGRLVVPCDHTEAKTKVSRSHVIYSDDRGSTWKLGGVLGEKTNECQLVERRDGSLLINMRSYHGRNRRAVAASTDGGLSWSPVRLDEALIEPVCQAGLIRLGPARGAGPDRLLFSNPASVKREKMTVRLSSDGGRTWAAARRLYEGPSAYSSLAELPGGEVGCLYECGKWSAYERITLARFPLGWLTDETRKDR
jgi:sialidase-1